MIQEETDYLNSPTTNFLKPSKGNPTPLFKCQVLQTTPSERKHGGKHLCLGGLRVHSFFSPNWGCWNSEASPLWLLTLCWHLTGMGLGLDLGDFLAARSPQFWWNCNLRAFPLGSSQFPDQRVAGEPRTSSQRSKSCMLSCLTISDFRFISHHLLTQDPKHTTRLLYPLLSPTIALDWRDLPPAEIPRAVPGVVPVLYQECEWL